MHESSVRNRERKMENKRIRDRSAYKTNMPPSPKRDFFMKGSGGGGEFDKKKELPLILITLLNFRYF